MIPLASSPETEGQTLEIKVDQVGYPTGLGKVALVVHRGAVVPTSFELRRAEDDRIVLPGKLSSPFFDPDSGDMTQTADFTGIDRVGSYYLNVAGLGRSVPFRIAPDVYTDAFKLTARSFYGQRCGTAVDLGNGFHHDACHKVGSYDLSSGRTGPHSSAKGWHDAGDYGRYVVSSSVTSATLLLAVELWGQGGMGRINLRIPESGHGIPDLLSETRWGIEWMLAMQDSDGGVWHKQTSAHFPGFVPPEKDALPRLVIGSGRAPFKTSCATADFTAVTAIASRLYRQYDPTFADRCLVASKNAWGWLTAHPSVTFKNPPGITTGEYGDEQCGDEQLWAAAELSRATADESFEAYFTAHYREFLDRISSDEPPSWSNTAGFALWAYALAKGRNISAVKEIEDRSAAAADAIAQRVQRDGYQNTLLRKNYVWGSNGVAANYSFQLLIADRFSPKRQYREAAAANLHYLFGRNPFSLSFVTGLGANSVRNIHHRPSAGLKQPWPGLLSGGPNAGREDPEMQRLIPAETPAAKAFLDLQESYASNEVAINWNAPLVFALAGLLPE
ncbi:MAG: glycoside hydrolase family 9 protein [Bryobacteraceae bacterium]